MTLLKSKTLSVSINSKPKTIYEFVLNLENFPKWAKMACRSIKLLNGEWIAETPKGKPKLGSRKEMTSAFWITMSGYFPFLT